jgi:agmatinase
VGEENLIFADAEANFEDAQIVILGVSFDGTSSHRAGSSKAPQAIRAESYNYESYLPKYGLELTDIPLHDLGDVSGIGSVTELMEKLPGKIEDIIKDNKFLIALGGEHSITIPIVKKHLALSSSDDIGYIYFDAHLDFRDSYLDEKFSHACISRRVAEIIGIENIIGIGIRSYSSEEAKDAEKQKIRFLTAELVNEVGMKQAVNDALEILGTKKIYLSIDMDVFDPSYAPGVGNPE